MSQYLILIYQDEEAVARLQHARPGEITAAHEAFISVNRDVVLGGNALQPTSTATTVRRDGTDVVVTDAAFAETKEALGGYYLIEAADLDKALGIAALVPAHFGCVEVRPIHRAR